MLKCKKITAFFLACLMLLCIIVPTGEAFAQGANHLSKTRVSRMEVKDRKGNTIDLNEKIEEDKDCRLEIDWDASEYKAEINEGDYFNITLPKNFEAAESNFAIRTPDGVQVANAHVNRLNSEERDTLNVVFTRLVEDKTDVKGSIAIEGSLLSINNPPKEKESKIKKDEESIEKTINTENNENFEKTNQLKNKNLQNIPTLGNPKTVLSDIRLIPLDKDNQGNEKTNYLTHEKVTFNAGFSTSNTSGKLDNTKFIITMPAEYIKLDTPDDYTDDDGIQLSRLDSADHGPDLQLVDGNWVITYTYNDIPGGYSGDVPISIRTVMGDTPNGYKLPITVKVVDKDGNTLTNGETTKEFTFKTEPPKHRKRIGVGNDILDIGERTIEKFNIGPAKDNEGNVLSGELGQTIVPEGHRPVNFRFDLYEKARIHKGEGARKYEKVVIEDKLPEGAVFIQSENPGWAEITNEKGEKILRYGVNYPEGVDFNYKPGVNERNDNSPIRDTSGNPIYLKLYFPGATVRENNIDKLFTNSSKVELTPHDMKFEDKVTQVYSEVNFKLAASTPAVEVAKRGLDQYFSDVVEDRSRLQRWTISVCNFSDVDFTSLEIRDFLGDYEKIDSKASKESINEMNLVKLEIPAKNQEIFKGSFDIYAINRDGNKQEVAKNISIDKDYTVDLPEDTISVLLVATPGSIFYGQGFDAKDEDKNKIIVRVYSNFKDENPKGVLEDEIKYNSTESKASGLGVTSKQEARDHLYLQPVDRNYKIGKEVVNQLPVYHVGTDVTFKIKAWLGNLYVGDKNNVVRIVDLLPDFTEYVENSVEIEHDNRKIVKNKEPKVVENYMGMGKTALIWEFGPLENNTDQPIQGLMDSNFYNLEFDYKIKIKKGAIGKLQNDAYLGFEGETTRTPVANTSSDDIVDANGNKDTTDKVSKSSSEFTVAPPKELVGMKFVRGSEDTNYISSSGHATSEINGGGVYKLRLQNTNSIDYEHATLIDVLPYVGDYTLSSAATSGYETEYRKSDFQVKLSGPVKFVEPFKEGEVDSDNTQGRFDVFYSFNRPQSENSIGDFSFGTGAWKTEQEIGTSWDRVKAIKIELKKGEVIKADCFDDFYVEFKMPGDQSLTEDKQINNSFAFSTSPSANSLNESNIVKLKPIMYKVSGISWEDKDQDGTYTEGEKLLANTKVKLMKINEDGSFEVAKDTEGKEYVTTTDENGHYEFNVYNKGKYFVEMIRPDNYNTTKNVEDSDKGNHMTDNLDEENNNSYINSSSKEFDLNKNHKEQIINGGWLKTSSPWTPITPPKEDIKVEKIWQGKDGKEISAPVDKIEVELYRDGEKTDKKLELNKSNNWSGEFKDLDVQASLNAKEAYKYTIKEVGEKDNKLTIDDSKYQVTYGGTEEKGFKITNKLEETSSPWTPITPPKEDIKVEKIWQGKDGKEMSAPVDKIEVELYRDGEKTDKKLELNASNNWSGEFKDLDVVEKLDSEKAYEYSVKEVGEKEGNIKLSDSKYKVSYDGSMEKGFKITNKLEETSNPWTPITPSKEDIKVEKIWQGKDGKEITAPVDKIEVELYRGGKATGEKKELSKENSWKAEFKDLDVVEKVDSEKAYEYTVKEVGEEKGKVVIGNNKYEVKYSGSMNDGFTITNEEEPTIPPTPLDPPKEDIKVEKIWQGKDGKEISAPVDKIEVELYRDGKSTGKKLELNKANNWSGEFKDLDVVEKVDSKEAFKYSVKEAGEETGSTKLNGNWYKVNYSGSMKDGFTITNKEEPKTPPTPPTPSEPDTITIEVKKDWTLYGNKPVDKIMVELYRDGKATGKLLELNRDNNWSGEFKNLDVKESANSKHDYHYTIKEMGEVGNTIKLDGRWFDVNYLGNKKDGFTIVNKEEKQTEPGKPEEPNTPNKPNDPQEPNKPETPKEPEKPNNPGTPVKPNTPKTPLPGKQLPKTGNGLNPSTYAWILLGLGNLSTFAGIRRKKRIRSRRKKNVK